MFHTAFFLQKPKKKNTKVKAEGDSPRKKKQEEQPEVWKWYGHSKIPSQTVT